MEWSEAVGLAIALSLSARAGSWQHGSLALSLPPQTPLLSLSLSNTRRGGERDGENGWLGGTTMSRTNLANPLIEVWESILLVGGDGGGEGTGVVMIIK